MSKRPGKAAKLPQKIVTLTLAVLLLIGSVSVAPAQISRLTGKAAAACTNGTLPTTYGKVTQTVSVATAGTYRVWSRIKAPDSSANSYYFQVDGGCAYNVGDSTSIPANSWTWVNYQDGSTNSPISVTLSAGSHTLTYTGKEAGVQLDKVMLLIDTSCTPTGLGDNCAVSDTTAPTTSITSPSSGATVNGTVNITANATDASGVSMVQFLVDGSILATDSTAAYAASWDTTKVTDGSHSLQVRAYDIAGNMATSAAVTVTVHNAPASDTTAPSVVLTSPANGSSVANGAAVTMNATASDNVGVTKVEFYVDSVLKASDTSSPYSYNWSASGTGTHTLSARAYDASGNTGMSSPVSISVTGATGIGDVNGDGRVNAIDLSAVISHDGQNYPAADFNSDGTVGAADLAILLGHWTW